MSASSTARPLRSSLGRHETPARSESTHRPHLTVVEGTKGDVRRAVAPLLLAGLLLFVFAIVLPLVINTDMARMSYAIRDQRVVLSEHEATIETLEAELLLANSTENLQERATEIGMVPAAPIGVISLQDHEILGGEPAQ